MRHLILNAIAPTEGHNFMAEVFEHMNPTSMQLLRKLNLKLQLTPHAGPGDPLMGLPRGLARMPARSSLEEICINLSICISGEWSAHMQHWGPLDEILGDRNRFPRLERIQILVSAAPDSAFVEVDQRIGDWLVLLFIQSMPEECFSTMRKIYGANFTFQAG